MKKYILFTLLYCCFGAVSSEAFEYRGIPVKYTIQEFTYSNYSHQSCVDFEKFREYSMRIQMKQEKGDINDYENYMIPECLPYAKYIRKFDKIATKYYLDVLKEKKLPLSAHAYVILDRNGKIEGVERAWCTGTKETDYKPIDGSNLKCKNTIDILNEIKIPKFTFNMKSEYLAFNTNIVNFKGNKNPNFTTGVKSSMPMEIKIKKRVWEYKTCGQIFNECKDYLMLKFGIYR